MDNSFLLDAMEWSYSRVNAFAQCPRMFELEYLLCMDKKENAFAQWGSLLHSLLERYFRGQIELWDLQKLYLAEYEKDVTCRFPWPRLQDSYYERGLEFCRTFDADFGVPYTVLAIEDRYHTQIASRPFVGIMDLVLKTPNGIVVCDHKSRGKWKSKAERRKYLRQLNLYALRIREAYGEYPVELWFHKFREGVLDREPFSVEAMQQDRDWLLGEIDKIYAADSFPESPDKFFCNNLCSVREHCPCSMDCPDYEAFESR